MISESQVKYLWQHRHEYINVQGVMLDEEQTKYLIEVLQLLYIPYDDCYVRNTTIVARCLESYNKGEHPRDCADKLTQLNKVVAENA
jgi:hypothetical protein